MMSPYNQGNTYIFGRDRGGWKMDGEGTLIMTELDGMNEMEMGHIRMNIFHSTSISPTCPLGLRSSFLFLFLPQLLLFVDLVLFCYFTQLH